MTDPKIKFSIEAGATGGKEIEALANSLERLDGSIDPAIASRAAEVAAELRQIGAQQQAVATFVALKERSQATAAALAEAQAKAQAFARELAQASTVTRAQQGQMERLSQTVRDAKAAHADATLAVQTQRSALASVGVATSDLAAAQRELTTRQRDAATAAAAVSTAHTQAASAAQALAAAQARAAEEARAQAAAETAAATASAAAQAKLAAEFKAAVATSEQARAAMVQARKAAEAYAESGDRVAESAAVQSRRQRDLLAALDQAEAAYRQASQAQADMAATARTAGLNVADLADHQRAASAASVTGARQSEEAARAAGSAYSAQAAQAKASAAVQVQAAKDVHGELSTLGAQLAALRNLASAALGGQLLGGLAGQLANTADAYANLEARIKLVTGAGQGFEQAMQGVFEVATATNTSIEATGTLFTRLAQANLDMGKSQAVAQAQALDLVRTINQAVQISGSSAQASEAAVQQLIQAIQGGVLRGEEFNSVMEQAPRLAKALADSLGVTTGELRKMAEAGQLSAEAVITSLQSQSATLQREFAQLPPTVGRAVQNLSTAWTQYIGEADKANGASRAVAGAIDAVAKNLDTLAGLLYAAGKAALAYQAVKLASTFLGIGAAATTAATGIGAVTAATVANAAAGRSAAGAASGFSKVLSGLGSLNTVGILAAIAANASEIGQWLGEATAKAMGWGRVIRENEAAMELSEKRLRALKQEQDSHTKSVIAAAAPLQKELELLRQGVEVTEATVKAAGARNQLAQEMSRLLETEAERLSTTALASMDLAKAADGNAAAHERLAEQLRRKAIVMEVAAGTQRTLTEETRNQIKAAQDAASVQEAAATQARVAAEVAKNEASARALAVAQTHDNSAALEELAAKLDKARDRTEKMRQAVRDGWATEGQLNDALREQSRLTKLVSDAQEDRIRKAREATQAAENQAQVERIGADVKRDLIEAEIRMANAEGDTRRSLELTNQLRQHEIDTARQSNDAKRTTINLTIQEVQEELKAITATDEMSLAKKRELEQRLAVLRAKLGEVTASDKLADAMQRELDKAKQLQGAQAAGIGGSEAMAAAKEKETAAREANIAAMERELVLAKREAEAKAAARNTDLSGFAKDMTGSSVVNAAGATLMSVYNELKGYGLSDEEAKQIARDFATSDGRVPFNNNPGQTKYGGSTLSEAIQQAAQDRIFDNLTRVNDDTYQAPAPAPWPPAGSVTATGSMPAADSSGGNYSVTIKLGSTSTRIQTATPNDAQLLSRLITQLERDRQIANY